MFAGPAPSAGEDRAQRVPGGGEQIPVVRTARGVTTMIALPDEAREALERAATERDLHIIPERERIEDKVDALLRRMADGDPVFLRVLFADAADRAEIILTFIAILELVRLQALRISQSGAGGDVLCTPTERLTLGGEDFRDMLLASIVGDAAAPAAPSEPTG